MAGVRGRAPLQLYRKSQIGESLTEALDDLINQHNLPEELAVKVLEQFDQVNCIFLKTLYNCKLTSITVDK